MVTLWHWHTEPLLVGGILFAGWLYAILVGPLRGRFTAGPFPRARATAWGTGLLSFYLAVGSPLDPLGENFLFSAHMAQHLVLMYASALLLVLGLPPWLADAALSRWPTARWTVRGLTHPVIGGVLATASLSVWHYPPLYEAALVSKPIHALEHLTMLAGSMLVWWTLVGPSRLTPPLPFGAGLLYLFAVTVAQVPVFAYLVFASRPHYPTYAFAPRLLPLDPLQDQILGGILMKATGMFVALAFFAWTFYRWSRASPLAHASPPGSP